MRHVHQEQQVKEEIICFFEQQLNQKFKKNKELYEIFRKMGIEEKVKGFLLDVFLSEKINFPAELKEEIFTALKEYMSTLDLSLMNNQERVRRAEPDLGKTANLGDGFLKNERIEGAFKLNPDQYQLLFNYLPIKNFLLDDQFIFSILMGDITIKLSYYLLYSGLNTRYTDYNLNILFSIEMPLEGVLDIACLKLHTDKRASTEMTRFDRLTSNLLSHYNSTTAFGYWGEHHSPFARVSNDVGLEQPAMYSAWKASLRLRQEIDLAKEELIINTVNPEIKKELVMLMPKNRQHESVDKSSGFLFKMMLICAVPVMIAAMIYYCLTHMNAEARTSEGLLQDIGAWLTNFNLFRAADVHINVNAEDPMKKLMYKF